MRGGSGSSDSPLFYVKYMCYAVAANSCTNNNWLIFYLRTEIHHSSIEARPSKLRDIAMRDTTG